MSETKLLKKLSTELRFSYDAKTSQRWLIDNINSFFLYSQNSCLTDNTSKAVLYQIPANETLVDSLGSNCGEKEDTLKVSWKFNNSFELKFKSNVSLYDLSSFVINLNVSSLFNDSAGELMHNNNNNDDDDDAYCLLYLKIQANQTVTIEYSNESFEIPANFSYHCNREQRLNATDGFLTIAKVQFEAFKKNNDQKFSAAKDCDSNITPDIVPIAVGISLIALIVVVLIAYIVGRRRQQARGYLNIM